MGELGEKIIFSGKAKFGTSPYTYNWYSDIDGYLGSGSKISTSKLSACVKNGEVVPHTITLEVTDNNGNTGSDMIDVIIQSENNPPDPPEITGPKKGKTGEELNYQITTSDPEEDAIHYYISINDGENTGFEGWLGPYQSGEAIDVSYTWQGEGTQWIFVKAKDERDAESWWSMHEVEMPKYKMLDLQLLLLKFLENHPHLFLLLRQIMRL
jgi:hypothetical protein